MARRTVLVVDGDPQSLRIVDVSLRRAGFDVRAASDGTVAASLIDREPPPDLVIADVDLPGIDGFELCRRTKAHPGKIPFVFLARPNTANRIKSIELGADDYLAKPVFVKEVVSRVSALLQRHERERLSSGDTLNDRVSGSLADLSMIDILQTIAANGRSGVVHLRTPAGARGELYFRKGAVVDAEVGRVAGADAVYRLLSWTEGRFEIEWRNIRRRDTVVLSAPALLMEGMRRLDEWTRQLQQLPPLESVFEVDYRLLAERLADIPDEVNGILRLFDGVRTAMQVIDDCGLSDLEALTVIGKLSSERLIRNVAVQPSDGDDDDGKSGPDLEGWLSESGGPAASPSEGAAADLGMRRASDQGAHGAPSRGTVAPPPAVVERPTPPAAVPERRDRASEHRFDEPVPYHAGIPEARPDEPAVVIPFPHAPAPSMRQTLSSPSGGPMAAMAGEISNGVPTPASAAPAPTQPIPAAPRSTEPGLGPLPVLPAASSLSSSSLSSLSSLSSPSLSPSPSAAEPVHVPVAAPVPVLAEPAPPLMTLPPRRDSAPKVPELPFSDSASRWMTEGDEIHHTGRSKSEALEELALPSRFRSTAVIAAVLVVAGGTFFGLRAFRGGHAAESVGNKTTTEPSGAAMAEKPAEVPAASPPPGVVGQTPPAPPTVAAEGVALPDTAARPPAGAANPGAAPAVAGAAADSTAQGAGAGTGTDQVGADGADFSRLLATCQAVFTAGRMKDATTACTAAVQANPESAKAIALLAHAEFNRNHPKDALSWAEKAVKIDPKVADAYVIIGGVQQDAGRNAEAKAAYRKYLELAPKGQYAADLRAIVDSL